MKEKTIELLCFQVGERIFAVDIMGIREILRAQPITLVPEAPSHIAGVLNLRGELLPVVDLRQVLPGAAEVEPAEDPNLIVVRAAGRTAGVLVDRVLEVVSVGVAELIPVPGVEPSGDAIVVAAFRKDLDGADNSVVLLVRLGVLFEEELMTVSGGPS
jgi:purine-binding chemotaxis protein CheW